MGCCSSAADDLRNRVFPKETPTVVQSDLSHEKKKIEKILLIGTGGCGKSTLFRNLRMNNGVEVLDERAMDETKNTLRSSLVQYMVRLMQASSQLEEKKDAGYMSVQSENEDISDESKSTISEFIEIYCKITATTPEEFSKYVPTEVDLIDVEQPTREKLGTLIEHIWSLNCIQNAFKYRGNNYQLPANMCVFFPRAKEMMVEDYQPSMDDFLKCYVRTTGVIHYHYSFEETVFNVIDMGAQRSERGKWRKHFDNTSVLLFLVALNHYNEVLFEDEHFNAMHEAINVFSEYSNDDDIGDADIFLLFTKQDLFEQSLKDFPLSMCFGREIKGWDGPEYWEGPDYALMPGSQESVEDWNERRPGFEDSRKAALDFIMDVFKSRYKGKKRVYIHVMDPIDADSVKEVFWDVQNVIIKSTLRKSGLMGYYDE